MSPTDSDDGQIAAVRAFNRFYTRKLGVLDQQLLKSPFSLSEARVLYELAHREDAGRQGDRDRTRPRSRLPQPHRPEIRRRRIDHPQAVAVGPPAIPARSHRQGTSGLCQAGAQLRRTTSQPCSPRCRPATAQRLIGAMATIERLLGAAGAAASPAILRDPRPGDMGWVVQSHGALYAREYGFDSSFEGLVAEIAAKFLTSFDASRERCWIAEHRRRPGRLGLSGQAQRRCRKTAAAAGRSGRARTGLGQRLVGECIALRASLRLSQDHAVDPEHPGRRAQDLSGRRLRAGRHRAAPQFRPGPGRRDLGARAVTGCVAIYRGASRRSMAFYRTATTAREAGEMCVALGMNHGRTIPGDCAPRRIGASRNDRA